MQTFIMTGKYSPNALKHASANRTRKAEHLIGRYHGKVRSMFATLGDSDLIMIVDLPGVEDAVKVSTGLMELTGIAFTTIPAIPVSEFDKLLQEI